MPDYIHKRREEMSKAQADYDAFVNEYFKRGALRTMNQEERVAILDGELRADIEKKKTSQYFLFNSKGLKKCWDEIHHEYQLLSVVIDTIPKKQRKERLEHDMKCLEKDIDLIQRHQNIYIAD